MQWHTHQKEDLYVFINRTEDVMRFKSFRLKNGSLIIEERRIVDNTIPNQKFEEKKIIWWMIFLWRKK